MPLSDEAFQRQVLADLAAIKASQVKDEKAFDVYRAKADELIQQQATNKQSLKDAHCRIDDLRDDIQASEVRLKIPLKMKSALYIALLLLLVLPYHLL